MAFSAHEGKQFFKDWLIHFAQPLGYHQFLDIGAGAGWYGKLIREVYSKGASIIAVELFEPYIKRHELHSIYDVVVLDDARKFFPKSQQDSKWDIIIMGDVLEHLTKQEAIALVKEAKKRCRFAWCALPLKVEGRNWSTGYNQGKEDYEENPANEHLHEWTFKELAKEMKPMWIVPYVQTGTFLIEGDVK